VVCIVPYSEAAYGFDAGEELRVLTSTGERRATVLRSTHTHPFNGIPDEIAKEAGFESGLQVAERFPHTPLGLVAVVRFRVHEVIMQPETLLERVRRTLGW